MVHDENFPPNDDELLGWRYVSVTIQITMLRDHCSAEAFMRQALADLCAAVVKLEGPRLGDYMRQFPPAKGGVLWRSSKPIWP